MTDPPTERKATPVSWLGYLSQFLRAVFRLSSNRSVLPHPRLDVWINRSVESVSGRPWPRHRDETPLQITMTSEPYLTVLHLPSGREIHLESASTTLKQKNGVVTLVSVLPLFSLVDFKVALDKVESLAKDLQVENDRFYETIRAWRDRLDDRALRDYMAEANLEENVDLFVNVRSHPRENGWFIALDFEAWPMAWATPL